MSEQVELESLRKELQKITEERDRLLRENEAMRLKGSSSLTLRNRTSIKNILGRKDEGVGLIGSNIGVAGWIRTVRLQGGGAFAFVEINDGSMHKGLQVVVDKDVPGFQHFEGSEGAKATTGASLFIKGGLVSSPAKGQKVELKAFEVIVLGLCPPVNYPIAKKGHTLEHLRTYAHLRPRTNTIGCMFRVRNALAYATHKFYQDKGFLYLHAPLITSSDCEGAGEMFQVTTMFSEENLAKIKSGELKEFDFSKDFFGRKTFLTVSGQLSAEAYSCALTDVYTFGPTFRAEKSNTPRHLAEFWMIEPEIAFADLKDDMDLAEDYLKYCIEYALTHCAEDLEALEKIEQILYKQEPEKEKIQKKFKETLLRKRLTSIIAQPFHRLTYTEAVDIVSKVHEKTPFQKAPSWGGELATDHEKYLAGTHFGKPVIVSDYPKEIKAFYMRLNDDNKTVAAMDVLVPGLGEIIGGSQREERLEVLESRLVQSGLSPDTYSWYLDLRRYGTVPHAGFGLGFERLVCFVTGLDNLRDSIPFPRFPDHADF
eukprot:TRINITY_DN2192_c0_g1_i1.p1 TRINITY_DN2192_c0_g1~~TRINITY_DN2192_c0_g1_i1.p1  ORF type:complete len:540 (+),score=96.87 TRINITY_DN2192_c0_g1_i1:120-1739(+)